MAHKHFEFGPFRLDAAEHLLLREEQPVQLPPKAFEMLLLLVENGGHVLQKNALMAALWPDSFVEESNLTQNVFLLRKALGEDRGEQHYIKTVPRVGYRFIAPVRMLLDESDAVVVESHSRERIVVKEEIVEHEEETTQVDDETAKRPQTAPDIVNRVAFFTRFARLRVATILVSASALLIGSAVVVARFFPANTAARDARNEAGSAAENSVSPAAYEAYKKGRALWNQRTAATLFSSIAQFEQAIQKDPNFALAYDGLADAYAFDHERWHEAEALARKALDIDKRLAEPHATLGFIRTFWKWNWKDGEREFKQAIELNPNYATAHQWYAIHLAIKTHLVEAEVEMRRALELEPDSAIMNADMGQILYFNRKYDEAIAACKKSLAIDPGFFNAHQYLYEIYCEKGLYDEAFAEVLKLSGTSGAATFGFAEGAQKAYQTKGIRGFWQWRLQELGSAGERYEVAEIYARLGEKNKAFIALEQAWHEHEFNMVFLYANPTFFTFHGDARFLKITGRMWPPSP